MNCCRLLVNGKDVAQTEKNIRSTRTANGTSFGYGPLDRSDNGSILVCETQGMKSLDRAYNCGGL